MNFGEKLPVLKEAVIKFGSKFSTFRKFLKGSSLMFTEAIYHMFKNFLFFLCTRPGAQKNKIKIALVLHLSGLKNRLKNIRVEFGSTSARVRLEFGSTSVKRQKWAKVRLDFASTSTRGRLDFGKSKISLKVRLDFGKSTARVRLDFGSKKKCRIRHAESKSSTRLRHN